MRRASATPTNAPAIASTASVQNAQSKPEWFALLLLGAIGLVTD